MIEAKDLALFDIVDTVEEAWAKLVRRGLKSAQPRKLSLGFQRGDVGDDVSEFRPGQSHIWHRRMRQNDRSGEPLGRHVRHSSDDQEARHVRSTTCRFGHHRMTCDTQALGQRAAVLRIRWGTLRHRGFARERETCGGECSHEFLGHIFLAGESAFQAKYRCA